MSTLRVQLSGLTCQSCVGKVRERLLALPGVTQAEVSLQQADISASQPLTVNEINDWLSSVGKYRASLSVEEANSNIAPLPTPSAATYRPLIIVLIYLLLATGAGLWAFGRWEPMLAMRLFMGGFFLVFSFFKFLNLSAFAQAYARYDILAAAWKPYGLVYPFLELGLGLAYVAGWQSSFVNAFTAVLMAVSLIGVLKAVTSKTAIRCACLGTVFQLPMSTVTIVEDGLMLLMAVLMLLM